MNIRLAHSRLVRRLAVCAAAAAAAVGGVATTSVHADTNPENFRRVFAAAEYSNGCSFPGANLIFDQSPPLVDPSPWAAPWVFFVSFRAACDMHDAGYSGGIVFDPINGGIVDTRGLSRSTIDVRFYNDLLTSCNRQIGWNAPAARAQCYTIASTYYAAVRAAGAWLFDASPSVPGLQFTGTRPNN
jgi:Prokaryotic phospholipase A2